MSVVFNDVKATWFDDEETASGHSAKTTVGVSLPIHGIPETNNSPIPDWVHQGTNVRVFAHDTGPTLDTQVIDVGPDTRDYPDHLIDLSAPALSALGLDPSVGVYQVDFRIFEGDFTDEGE
jgi:hypothetical protein